MLTSASSTKPSFHYGLRSPLIAINTSNPITTPTLTPIHPSSLAPSINFVASSTTHSTRRTFDISYSSICLTFYERNTRNYFMAILFQYDDVVPATSYEVMLATSGDGKFEYPLISFYTSDNRISTNSTSYFDIYGVAITMRNSPFCTTSITCYFIFYAENGYYVMSWADNKLGKNVHSTEINVKQNSSKCLKYISNEPTVSIYPTHAPTTSKPTVSPAVSGITTPSATPDSLSNLSLSLILGISITFGALSFLLLCFLAWFCVSEKPFLLFEGLTEGEESGVFMNRRSDLYKTSNEIGDNHRTLAGHMMTLNSSGNDSDSGRGSTGILGESLRESVKPVAKESDYDRMIRQGFNVVNDDEDDYLEEGGNRRSISRSSLRTRYSRQCYGNDHKRDSWDGHGADSGRGRSPFRQANNYEIDTRERMSESVFARPMVEDKSSSASLTHRRSFSPRESMTIGENNEFKNSNGQFLTTLNGGNETAHGNSSNSNANANPKTRLGPINDNRDTLSLMPREEFSTFNSNTCQVLTSNHTSRFSLGRPESNWITGDLDHILGDQRKNSPFKPTENSIAKVTKGNFGSI